MKEPALAILDRAPKVNFCLHAFPGINWYTAGRARRIRRGLAPQTCLGPGSVAECSSNVVYNLKLEVSAPGENADTYSYRYFITVKDRPDIRVSCEYDNPVYEGSEDIAFDCSASGGSSYAYAWSSPGAPADTSLLSATDISSPTFDVPLDVDATRTTNTR